MKRSCVFQNGSCLPPARSTRRFFSSIYHGNLFELLEINLTKLQQPPDWVPLAFLPLRIVHVGPPAIRQLQFLLSHPTLVPIAVPTHESRLQQTVTLHIHLSASPVLGTAVFPVSSPLSRVLQEMIFHCSIFYMWLGQSGGFPAPYIQNWKPHTAMTF